ncbi:MAG: 5'-deoxynucleotidase [Bacillota bacterium]|jgi:5'-deoxynucleotidase
MSHFFAYISRLKLIKRWSLMRNTSRENTQEHSWQVAVIAHSLAVIKNEFFGGSLNPERAALLGLYHDVSETITGDLPTPVKYANSEITSAFHSLEAEAADTLKNMLPAELQNVYRPILQPQASPEEELVHIADKICAYIKCAEEVAAGNHEFAVAHQSIGKKLKGYEDHPEVKYFMENFVPSFSLTLDEISK